VTGTDTPIDAATDSPLARRIRLGGWLGMVCLLAAFALRLGDVLDGTSLVYIVLNVVGAVLVAAQCALQRAWPALVLELGWVVLTIASLWVAP